MEIKKSNFLLKSKRIKIQFRIVIIIFILMIVLLCGVFFTFTNQYNDSINKESINNIEEINYQIKSYISNNLRNNWNALDSITNTINSIDDISEEELFKLLQKERVLWDTSSIIFYTEDNKGYDDSGNHIVDDLDTIINKIKKENKVIDMFQSSILYGVKVETESLFRGSKIVALSITRDIDTLIDRYNIATFDGNADIYITRNDGKIVTKYKNTSKIHLDNIQELFPSGKLKDINNIVVDYNSLFNGNNSFYYESNDNIDKYIAIETF